MFTRNIHLRNIFHQNIKNFANHSKVILIGAGTGGISVANQLTHGKNFKKLFQRKLIRNVDIAKNLLFSMISFNIKIKMKIMNQ